MTAPAFGEELRAAVAALSPVTLAQAQLLFDQGVDDLGDVGDVALQLAGKGGAQHTIREEPRD